MLGSNFWGEAGGLGWVEGRGQGKCLLAFPVLGGGGGQSLVPAGLETWPSGSFWSVQMGLFGGRRNN